MTSALLISDDPLLVEAIRRLLPVEIALTHLKSSDVAGDDDRLRHCEIVLSDTDDLLTDRLEGVGAIRQTHGFAWILLAQDLSRDERLQALAAGVDQILSNPPDREELVLVLRNLGRLLPAPPSVSIRQGDPKGDWVLDETRWCLWTPLGHEVQLQRAEAAILALLFASAGFHQSRADLAASFKSDRDDRNRSLDVAISKIRKKVRDASGLGLPLRTIRGMGYIFTGSARLLPENGQRILSSVTRDSHPQQPHL